MRVVCLDCLRDAPTRAEPHETLVFVACRQHRYDVAPTIADVYGVDK